MPELLVDKIKKKRFLDKLNYLSKEVERRKQEHEEIKKLKEGESKMDAWRQIKRKADKLARSEGISRAKGIAKVLSQNPDLYKAYKEENHEQGIRAKE